MTKEVLVAIITVSGSVIVAAVSYFLTKRHQREAEWRDSKLTHYKNLLSSISELAMDNNDIDAHRAFANAMNTLALVAPQEVVEASLAFFDVVNISSKDKSKETHDLSLARLLLAIRNDIGMNPKDNPDTFHYRLVGAPPKTINIKK